MAEWTLPVVEGEVEYRALEESAIVSVQHRRLGTTAWFDLAKGRWSNGHIVDLPYALPGMAQFGLEFRLGQRSRFTDSQPAHRVKSPRKRNARTIAGGLGTAALLAGLWMLELRGCANASTEATVNVTIDGTDGVDGAEWWRADWGSEDAEVITNKAIGACRTIGNNSGDTVTVVVEKRSGSSKDTIVFDCEFGPVKINGRGP